MKRTSDSCFSQRKTPIYVESGRNPFGFRLFVKGKHMWKSCRRHCLSVTQPHFLRKNHMCFPLTKSLKPNRFRPDSTYMGVFLCENHESEVRFMRHARFYL